VGVASGYASNLGNKTLKTYEGAKEKLSEKAKEGYGLAKVNITDFLSEASRKIQQNYDLAKSKTIVTYDKSKDTVLNIADQAATKAKEGYEVTKEKIGEGYDKAKGKISEIASDNKVKENVDVAKEKISDAYFKAKDSVSDFTNQVSEKSVKENYALAKDKISDLYEKTKRAISGNMDNYEDHDKENFREFSNKPADDLNKDNKSGTDVGRKYRQTY